MLFKSKVLRCWLVTCGLSVFCLLLNGFYTIKFYHEYRMLTTPSKHQRPEEQNMERVEIALPTPVTKWKTVLFWGSKFRKPTSHYRFGPETPEELRDAGCPIWQCNYTLNTTLLETADAIVVMKIEFGKIKNKIYRRPKEQRWIWLHGEAPKARKPKNITEKNAVWNPSFLVNWTWTYHSNSDIVGFYGYFTALNATHMPVIPNAMAEHPETMQKYKEGLASGNSLSDIMGPHWKNLPNKTKIVAWMSSHCPTFSKRESYIQELSTHMRIDTYGGCGTKNCTTRNPFGNDFCWTETLASYSFYMSMENKICDDYITEKVYLPMIHYLVPVVWGGSDYNRYLPPGSYIDARRYHPKDLAVLLTDLHNSPEAYLRYHLWRGYWQVHLGRSFCQLCYRLHTDTKEKHYLDIENWRLENGKCLDAPEDLFNINNRPKIWDLFLQHHNSTML